MKRWIDARGLLAATALAVLATGFAAPAWARTNYAVLMAVTAYPNLPPKNALIGPNHDAKLVREYLTTRAPIKFDAANVTILADGLDGANASPTRAEILATLAELADKAQPGDFVYLHYSGHGSQQPTLTPETETDGLDEILLPADSAPWDKQAKRMPNALLDDEIGVALDAVRDKGAFVWIVVDACHSGSVDACRGDCGGRPVPRPQARPDRSQRSRDTGGRHARCRLRHRPGGRGTHVRHALIEDAGERAIQTDDQTQTGAKPIEKGGMVAFFAAQTIETTPEMPLPKGVDGRGTLRPVHLHDLLEAGREPEHDLPPARPFRAAAIRGRTAPEADADLRGRTRCPRLRLGSYRNGPAVADRGQGQRPRRCLPGCCTGSPPAPGSPSCRSRLRSCRRRSAMSR